MTWINTETDDQASSSSIKFWEELRNDLNSEVFWADKIKEFQNGEPVIFEEEEVRNHICCDCGLVHLVYTEKVANKKAVTYWYRDDYETERLKKEKKP